jgi:hypothetical protein
MRIEYSESVVRGLIAIVVIAVTWWLTTGSYDIAEQWEAVFLMVIAYYFKDRPQADRAGDAVFSSENASKSVAGELTAQFAIAMLLLVATAGLFATTYDGHLRDSIAGAWVAGVTLAIAFYFKDVGSNATTTLHSKFRSALAITVGGATLAIVIARVDLVPTTKLPLPVQWVALAFVVISFYFKERGAVEPSATSKAREAARTTADATTA